MKAMWSGAITFGLVNIPVKAYTATGDHGLDLHHVHETDGGRVSLRWECKDCGETVPYGELAKGHEHEGAMVVLGKDELAALSEKSRAIDVLEFVDPSDIDPMMLSSSYYLAPPAPAKKRGRPNAVPDGWTRAYVLLRETLRRTSLVAVVRVTLRSRQSLAVLRVDEDVIVMQTLLWADEVREAMFDDYTDGRIPDAPEVTAEAIEQSAELVRSMATKWNPAAHTDSYAEGVRRLVAEKTGQPTEVPPVEPDAEIFDLTARLNANMAANAS